MKARGSGQVTTVSVPPPTWRGAHLGRDPSRHPPSAPRRAHLRRPPWPCPRRRAPLRCRRCSLPAGPRHLRPERTLRARRAPRPRPACSAAATAAAASPLPPAPLKAPSAGRAAPPPAPPGRDWRRKAPDTAPAGPHSRPSRAATAAGRRSPRAGATETPRRAADVDRLGFTAQRR